MVNATENASIVKLKPHIQLIDEKIISTNHRKIDVPLPTTVSMLSLTNALSDSYTYKTVANLTSSNTYWDLGSIWCDSDYDGICDAFMKLPDEGCSGPGCGAGMWQQTGGQCSQLDKYKYDPDVRLNRTYTWPTSLFGRYYSTCNGNVAIEYDQNCQ